jgi:hypothetical protein
MSKNVMGSVEPGDISALGSKPSHTNSAQDQYYALATAKLKAEIAKGGDTKLNYLAAQSPVEELTEVIANHLLKVRQGSPEWTHLCSLVENPDADRIQIARYLAEVQYKKITTESILSRYGVSTATATKKFEDVWSDAATAVRGAGGASGASATVKAVSQALGGEPPAGGATGSA